MCPYILYLFINWKGFSLEKMRSYVPVESYEESQPWMSWEEFNCKYRVLKSQAYSGQTLAWNVLHSGAKFGPLCSIQVTERELVYSVGTHRLATKSTRLMKGSCSCGFENRLGFCIQTAPESESRDSFICLESEQGFLHEVHQYKKKTTGSINLESFREERAKAASSHDLFLLFCTGEVDLDLSTEVRSAVVDESCWIDYYGLFASRFYYISTANPPSINDVRPCYLQMVRGVGPVTTELILSESKKRKFDSIEDAEQRLPKISRSVLERFVIP
jgi:hypothetical protein